MHRQDNKKLFHTFSFVCVCVYIYNNYVRANIYELAVFSVKTGEWSLNFPFCHQFLRSWSKFCVTVASQRLKEGPHFSMLFCLSIARTVYDVTAVKKKYPNIIARTLSIYTYEGESWNQTERNGQSKLCNIRVASCKH